jgi:hypothetical protein
MKTKTVIIGLLILVLGIGVLTGYSTARTLIVPKAIAFEWESSYAGDVSNASWTLTANLTKDDVVTVDYREAANWTVGQFDEADDNTGMAVLWIFLNITPINPPGNATEFALDSRLYAPPSSQGEGQERLVWYNATVMANGSIDPSPEISDTGVVFGLGGRIPWDGTYEASLVTWPDRVSPPSYLAFFHNVTMTDYPNTYLLPTGAVIVALGGTLSLVGVRSVFQDNSHSKIKRKKVE